MVCLPEPSSLPFFQYYDPATEDLKDLSYPHGFQPHHTDSYVLDRADWHPDNPNRRHKTSPNNPSDCSQHDETKSLSVSLAYMVHNEGPCHICGSQGTNCFGESCVKSFQSRTRNVERTGELRIEASAGGGNTSMGYGVFTGGGICRGTIVGEYLGRLLPLDWDTGRDQDHSYSFEVEDKAVIDARECGNITRFVNHSCRPNLDVVFITYGRRRCIAFVANRDVAPGEQLFIHYGDDYFGKSKPCLCDLVPYTHIPPKGSEPPTKIYAETLSLYWSSTIIDSDPRSPFKQASVARVLRTIPYIAQPLIREIRCNGFREVQYLNLNQFVGLVAKIEIFAMEPASLYVSHRFYPGRTWSDDVVISQAQGDLRGIFPTFGLGVQNNAQVLQKAQFPVMTWSRNDTAVRLSP